MIQVQILVGDLLIWGHRCHVMSHHVMMSLEHPGSLRSPTVFYTDSRPKRARDMGMLSLRLSRLNALNDKQQSQLVSPRDLNLRSNVDLTFQGHHANI